MIRPDEKDYEELFGSSYSHRIEFLEREDYGQNYAPIQGEDIRYWSPEDNEVLQEAKERVAFAWKVHRSTLDFLAREGYLHELEIETAPRRLTAYVLTPKGLGTLSKKFEGGTIRDALDLRVAKSIAKGIVGADQIATAATGLRDVVLKFLQA